MIQIAICDDTPIDLKATENLLTEYIISHPLPVSIKTFAFSSPLSLYEELLEGNRFDIYFLDILMPDINGIKLGQYIRSKHDDGIIIYLSASSDFLQQAFNLYAYQYQIKPVQRDKMFEILDRLLKKFAEEKEKTFLLSQKNNSFLRIPYQDICYLELLNRVIYFHLKDGRVEKSNYIRSAFEQIVNPLLEESSFLQPHKSFVVNLYYVRLLSKHSFQMFDGKEIPVSRKRMLEVKNIYTAFLLNETPHLTDGKPDSFGKSHFL